MTTLAFAYQSDPSRKVAILAAMRADIAADNLIKNRYWVHGKGCAIGCLIRSDSHEAAADHVGTPVELMGLFDTIFEGLPPAEAQAWPVDFLEAITPGADLVLVWPRFAHWLLTREVAADAAKDPDCAKTVAGVAALFDEWIAGNKPSADRWDGVPWAASADSAADADSAAYAAAARVARVARAAAARVARADSAAAARVARADSCYRRQAAQLLALLRAAPVGAGA